MGAASRGTDFSVTRGQLDRRRRLFLSFFDLMLSTGCSFGLASTSLIGFLLLSWFAGFRALALFGLCFSKG